MDWFVLTKCTFVKALPRNWRTYDNISPRWQNVLFHGECSGGQTIQGAIRREIVVVITASRGG